MSTQQGRKKAARTKNTMPPSKVLTAQLHVPVGHSLMPQDHHSNIPYPFSMYPHHPYYRAHQPYSYDTGPYPFTYHLHGGYPTTGTFVDPPTYENGYPGFSPPSQSDIKCVSGADENSLSSSENSTESSNVNAPPSTGGERHSVISHGGPPAAWFAASNTMYPGATQPNLYGNYQGYLNPPYNMASNAQKYNLQLVDSRPSGAVSHHAASRASGKANDHTEAISGTVSKSWESSKHYNDALGQYEPAALSGAAKSESASTGRKDHSIPSIYRKNPAALSGADIRSSSRHTSFTGDESNNPTDKTDMTSCGEGSQSALAAALSGAAGPSTQSSFRSKKGSLTVTTEFPTEPMGIYRPSSYSPSKGNNARLGLSFTTSSEQTSGRTASFSTTRTDSEEGPDDMAAAGIETFSGMYLNVADISQPPNAGSRMSPPKDKRSRKNELARQRSFKIKMHIEDILQKPESQITAEEALIFHRYETKRLMKNELSRNLAKGKKHRIMSIRSKPLNERTREEQMYLERAMKAKFRKNEGDRLRRLRAKESSLASEDSSSKFTNLEESFSEDVGVQVIPIEDRLAEYHDEPLSPDFRNAISFFSAQSPFTTQSLNASRGMPPPSLPEAFTSPDPAMFYAISPIRNPAFDSEYEQVRSSKAYDGNIDKK